MQVAQQTFAETATARGDVYGLLAVVFRAEPTGALIREIKAPRFSEILADLGLSLGDEFDATPPEQLAADLACEYARLFIGPGPHLSPHESLHVETGDGAENTFWGPQTVAVKGFIEATGLRYEENFTGMPDHISVEFELMRKLAERESVAWAEGEEQDARWFRGVQGRFFEEHLIQWVPGFCDKVVDQAQRSFYREMATLTKQYLNFEQEVLEEQRDQTQALTH